MSKRLLGHTENVADKSDIQKYKFLYCHVKTLLEVFRYNFMNTILVEYLCLVHFMLFNSPLAVVLMEGALGK